MSSYPLPRRVRIATGGSCVLSVEAGALIVAESASIVVDAGTRWLDGAGLSTRRRVETGAAFESREGGWLRVEAGAQGADIVLVAPPSRITLMTRWLPSLRAMLARATGRTRPAPARRAEECSG
ncbi:hypothetical protein ACDA63_19730 [Uliginosibacterium sp. sgz301328]|uniref:hypothetical protein n=1 Tax=Uliginosibacterium sp. sgz301328 TaxID=3243764 RepID=UPI00359E7004